MRAGSTPIDSASRACAVSMRRSPCTGMNALGRQSASTVLSSSAEPWPDTCTGAMSWCSTVAPARVSALTVSETASSLPGTGLADMITMSPDWIETTGWSRNAMRVSAESGSPCDPVHRIVTSRGARSARRPGLTSVPSATSA